MNKTLIFKDYAAFERREDKACNGSSHYTPCTEGVENSTPVVWETCSELKLAYREGGSCEAKLVMPPVNPLDGGPKCNLVEAGLYQVIIVRQRKRDGRELTPITSMYHCIAQDAEGAIKQVDGNAYPDASYTPASEQDISATATRIPFQIRGWGSQTF